MKINLTGVVRINAFGVSCDDESLIGIIRQAAMVDEKDFEGIKFAGNITVEVTDLTLRDVEGGIMA